MKNHDLVDLVLFSLGSTAKALIVTNMKDEKVFLPFSQIEHNFTGRSAKVDVVDEGLKYSSHAKEVEVTMPEWLANKAELI